MERPCVKILARSRVKILARSRCFFCYAQKIKGLAQVSPPSHPSAKIGRSTVLPHFDARACTPDITPYITERRRVSALNFAVINQPLLTMVSVI